MVFFLVFLIAITIVSPAVTLSRVGRIALHVVFALTLISGAAATIRHRLTTYTVAGLTVVTFSVALMGEFQNSRAFPPVETSLELACLLILVFMTIRQTVRPGPVTLYRVAGGIAGYLLIGFTWAYAYQLVVDCIPGAIHFIAGVSPNPVRQPTHLMYFSFVTLTTVGYGDVFPVHPAARSLAVAEALTGQLYVAILIASLVGMALQNHTAADAPDSAEQPTQTTNRIQSRRVRARRPDVVMTPRPRRAHTGSENHEAVISLPVLGGQHTGESTQ